MTVAILRPAAAHLARHRLRHGTPLCRCPYVVCAQQPHRWDCPAGIEQRRRLCAGKGGTRDV